MLILEAPTRNIRKGTRYKEGYLLLHLAISVDASRVKSLAVSSS